MSSDDEFITIKSKVNAEIKIKGSRFIGTAAPVHSVEKAEQFVQQMKKLYYDATHNCYAFSVYHHDQEITRYSDDSEPAGTAGSPMLAVIQGQELTNLAVVVTRYFGGTKLGKGGLIRAYTDCTKTVLNNAELFKKLIYTKISFTFPYDLTGNVMHLLSQMNGKMITSSYGDRAKLTIKLPKSHAGDFKEQIVEITAGKVGFE
ncbi:YigZ family protein [candidate division KSB1 bacterium]|nr:YigZ family protein [candidate division KSB1 bacterium]